MGRKKAFHLLSQHDCFALITLFPHPDENTSRLMARAPHERVEWRHEWLEILNLLITSLKRRVRCESLLSRLSIHIWLNEIGFWICGFDLDVCNGHNYCSAVLFTHLSNIAWNNCHFGWFFSESTHSIALARPWSIHLCPTQSNECIQHAFVSISHKRKAHHSIAHWTNTYNRIVLLCRRLSITVLVWRRCHFIR